MDENAVAVNAKNWDARVPVHLASEHYGVEDFVASRRPRIRDFERQVIGSVEGKSLLHLQCHIGIDTLSWALLGARVTGVDISPASVRAAESLAERMNIPASFVVGDVQRLELKQTFDLVYASIGVLCWIEDVGAWMRTAWRHLAPGGHLYLFDAHPFVHLIAESADAPAIRPDAAYFDASPHRNEWPYTYTDGEAALESPVTYQWDHTVSSILQPAIDAGFILERVQEFPFDFFQRLPYAREDAESRIWTVPGNPLPLTYALYARRP